MFFWTVLDSILKMDPTSLRAVRTVDQLIFGAANNNMNVQQFIPGLLKTIIDSTKAAGFLPSSHDIKCVPN